MLKLEQMASAVRNNMSHRGRDVEMNNHQAYSERRGVLTRDRSLDRQLEKHYKSADQFNSFPTAETYQSASNLDRDFPDFGIGYAEREQSMGRSRNLVRSRSIDPEIHNQIPDFLLTNYSFSPTGGDELQRSRNTVVLDLQMQVSDLNRQCAVLRQSLDNTREKLASSMNSVKTFWSPELKKERFLRKEETTRNVALSEQLKLIQGENQVIGPC